MSQLSIPQALQIALEHHFQGRVREAEAGYRQVLSLAPQNPEARQLLAVLAGGFGPVQAEYYFNLGVVLSSARRLKEAINCYQRALAINPSYAEAYYNLGNAVAMLGDFANAIQFYRRTLELRPDFGKARVNLARAHNDLGANLQRGGRVDEAIAQYRQAIDAAADFPDALSNLGNALGVKGLWAEAVEHCRRAVALRPDYAEAFFNLANALRETGKTEEAIDCYRRATELKPDFVEAHGNLGVALGAKGRTNEAIACHEKALSLRPGSAEAHSKLAGALIEAGRVKEAIVHGQAAVQIDPHSAEACNALGIALAEAGQVAKAIEFYLRAIALRPNYAEAYNSLGLARQNRMEVDEAIACFKSAIAIRPNYADAYNNLGTALLDTGQAPAAIEAYRKAVECRPDYHQAHSNLVATLYFDPKFAPQEILSQHRRWAQMQAKPLVREIKAHANDRDPERRLRIGYASPNFRKHVVGLFLQRLFEKHDHSQFEIVCFSDTRSEDEVTARLKGWADEWHTTTTQSDEEMAEFTRSKSIDILVDLNLHMAYERMLVFARKPAPIQVTYLAYAGTSGLETMDYRLTDAHLDPPGENDSYYCEESVRLRSYWCYRPWDIEIDVGELPATKNGYVTFGCLNNTAKDSDAALELWGKVMQAVPNSRLIVSAFAGSPRERILRALDSIGIESSRVEFTGWMELKDYLRTYSRIDLGLDPIPYNGGTTTCDALWMGVPMITLAGKLAVGRAGVTLMNQVGLPEFVAQNSEEYANIASDWATDLSKLAAVRSELRNQMLRSPLCDAEAFARDVENKYRWMWRRWCDA